MTTNPKSDLISTRKGDIEYKKILKIALIVILIIVLVVGGYFITLNMTKKQTLETVDKMFTALKTGDEEQIK